MPNFPEAGMLEDLCLQSVREKEKLACVEEFFACAGVEPKNIAKAKTLAWLSLRDPLANSLGIAAQNGHWDLGHSCFERLRKFVWAPGPS